MSAIVQTILFLIDVIAALPVAQFAQTSKQASLTPCRNFAMITTYC